MDRTTFLIIKLAIVIGVILVRVLVRPAKKGIYVPPPDPNNLQGHTCTGCQTQIVLYFDGQRCDHCSQPMHTACLAQHKVSLSKAA